MENRRLRASTRLKRAGGFGRELDVMRDCKRPAKAGRRLMEKLR